MYNIADQMLPHTNFYVIFLVFCTVALRSFINRIVV